jgi:hypothetical protein
LIITPTGASGSADTGEDPFLSSATVEKTQNKIH